MVRRNPIRNPCHDPDRPRLERRDRACRRRSGRRLRPRTPGPHRRGSSKSTARPRQRSRRPVRRVRRSRSARTCWRSRPTAACVRTHGGAIVARSEPARARVRHPRAAPAGREGAGSGRPPRHSSSDGESIVMDASTTALAVARRLKARGGWSQLTVITNGLRLASELAGRPGITVLMLGGRVRWEALSVVGQLGDGLFSRINVQKAFVGAAGLHPRVRPERRDRRGGADQALDGRRGARGHRASSTTRSGSVRRSRRSAGPTRSTVVLTRRPGAGGDGRRRSRERGIDVRLVERPAPDAATRQPTVDEPRP